MWKLWYSRTEQRWQYNTVHAHCMMDEEGYKHTLTLCNIYRCSTATMVAQMRLSTNIV